MAIRRRVKRLAGVLGIPALLLGTNFAAAQDGKTETGPPVTTPNTNQDRATPSTFAPPRVGSEVLTPVPATASDPAPPGTRVERVDIPSANRDNGQAPSGARGTGAAPAGAAGARGMAAPGTAPAASMPPGVMLVEGQIVDKIMKPGKDFPDEQIRFVLDPARNWAAYAAPGSVAPAEPENAATKDGDVRKLDVIVTKRTRLYTFARTPDGRVVADPTNPNAPSVGTSRSGDTPRDRVLPAVNPTNFTRLQPGQFLAVEYRKAGNLNEAAALSIIVIPADPSPSVDTPTVRRVGPSAGATSGAATAPATGRVPRIPNQPNGPPVIAP